MRRHTRLAILGVLLAGSLVSAQDKDKGQKPAVTPNYYPLEVGNKWTFKVTVGDNSVTAVSEITKVETFDKLTLARLDIKVAGEDKAFEHLRQTADGVFRHRNNGIELDPPLILLQYPAKAGGKWQGKLKVADEDGTYFAETKEEAVAVPAGKFKALRVTIRLEVKEQKIETAYWFVKDVGFVKQTIDAAGLNMVMELEKFEKGKADPKKRKTEESSTK